MKFKYKIKKRQFLLVFFGTIFVLFIIRLIFPSIRNETKKDTALAVPKDEIETIKEDKSPIKGTLAGAHQLNKDLTKPDYEWKRHKIRGVDNFPNSFPDVNDLQLTAAKTLGIQPISNRNEMELIKNQLVYIGINPYYNIKTLNHSIPYLVPKAQLLLTKIARNFLDSQYVKKISPSKLLVTSATRTVEDVEKLHKKNSNASTNSCHCYGTTFDISYAKFQPVRNSDNSTPPQQNNGALKFILAEVLNDLRKQELCYVKYESRQGCFHITVR